MAEQSTRMDFLDGPRQESGLQGAGCFLLPVQLTMKASAYQGFRSTVSSTCIAGEAGPVLSVSHTHSGCGPWCCTQDTHEGLQVAASARWRAGAFGIEYLVMRVRGAAFR